MSIILRRLSGIAVTVACSLAATSDLGAQKPPVVAAAADVMFALESIAGRFGAHSGDRVDLVFGSSGNLTRQIVHGAPFDLFLSADEAFVEKLSDAGLTRDRGTLYGVGRIVLFAPHGSPLAVDQRLDGLGALLERGGVARFAIANPEHAPYGRAAEAALRAKGLWEPIRPALILGESIVQASHFAMTRNAIGGILAYSLVLSPALRDRGTYALLPEAWHTPLRQRMVLMKRAGPTAERFYEYLQQPAAREIFRQYGFTEPAD